MSTVDLFFIIVFTLFALREVGSGVAWARDRFVSWIAWHLGVELEDEPEED